MDFTVLHDTLDNKKDRYTAEHYNRITCRASGNHVLSDFMDVYTKEGYDLACRMRMAKSWFDWFTKAREKGAVLYKQSISTYSEDGATVPECDIKAYNEQGEEVAYKNLAKTYFGYNNGDVRKRQKEWEKSIPEYFSSIIGDIVVYKDYLVWKDKNNID